MTRTDSSKAPWSERCGNTRQRDLRRVYRTSGAFAFEERVDMEFARLCDFLRPTTLAAIVVDLGNGPFPEEATEVETDAAQIEEFQVVAMDALIANVGEEEARRLIDQEEAS
jgi:hypothetical protein